MFTSRSLECLILGVGGGLSHVAVVTVVVEEEEDETEETRSSAGRGHQERKSTHLRAHAFCMRAL